MKTKGGQKSHKIDDVFYQRPLVSFEVDPLLPAISIHNLQKDFSQKKTIGLMIINYDFKG